MRSSPLLRLAGWSAYLSVAVMLGGAVFPIISVTGLIGKLGNLATMTLALSMVPLAFILNQLYSESKPGLSMAAALIGIFGMLSSASLQFLLLFEIVQPIGAADRIDDLSFTLIGTWLVMSGYLGKRSYNSLVGMQTTTAILAGIGMILVTTGFLISEPPPLWGFAGGILTFITYPIWAISLGRKLLSGQAVWQPAG